MTPLPSIIDEPFLEVSSTSQPIVSPSCDFPVSSSFISPESPPQDPIFLSHHHQILCLLSHPTKSHVSCTTTKRKSHRVSKPPAYLKECDKRPHWCNMVHYQSLSCAVRAHIASLDVFSEPCSYKEAALYPHWVAAMS